MTTTGAKADAAVAESDGRVGFGPGDAVPCERLPMVLADPREWEYPEGSRWVGALTVVETEAGRKVSRESAEEIGR